MPELSMFAGVLFSICVGFLSAVMVYTAGELGFKKQIFKIIVRWGVVFPYVFTVYCYAIIVKGYTKDAQFFSYLGVFVLTYVVLKITYRDSEIFSD